MYLIYTVIIYPLSYILDINRKAFPHDRNLRETTEIESLAIAPKYQRRGIGTALLQEFTNILDREKVGCYLRASEMGKELYERFGWRVLGVYKPDLRSRGVEMDYKSFFMSRDAVTTMP